MSVTSYYEPILLHRAPITSYSGPIILTPCVYRHIRPWHTRPSQRRQYRELCRSWSVSSTLTWIIPPMFCMALNILTQYPLRCSFYPQRTWPPGRRPLPMPCQAATSTGTLPGQRTKPQQHQQQHLPRVAVAEELGNGAGNTPRVHRTMAVTGPATRLATTTIATNPLQKTGQ